MSVEVPSVKGSKSSSGPIREAGLPVNLLVTGRHLLNSVFLVIKCEATEILLYYELQGSGVERPMCD